jgi:hypothetical protein
VPVDRGQVPAGLERSQVHLYRRRAIGQQGRDPVARLQAKRPERTGNLVHPAEQLTAGVLGAVGLDHRDPARILLRAAPEPSDPICSPPGPSATAR